MVLNKDPQKKEIQKINLNKNDLLIDGNNKDEIGIGSLNHGICLNRIIPIIKTRFVLFIDPDFFVLKKNWIEQLIIFMKKEKISILGVPWHPKWFIKYRFFPCSHFFASCGKDILNTPNKNIRCLNIVSSPMIQEFLLYSN